MKIAHINQVQYGSTGRIALSLIRRAKQAGHDARLFVPRGRHNPKPLFPEVVCFGGRLSEDSHLLLGRITGLHGYFSWCATWILLRKLAAWKPDIIHLHNLHNCYLNLPMLFFWLRKKRVPVVWTLHDCWSFTGGCAHYLAVQCDQWKSGCRKCSQRAVYPQRMLDTSAFLYRRKRDWFCSLERLTLVTPSHWMARQVQQSFLKDAAVRVIPNGIDLQIFHPVESNFRARNGIGADEILLLGVASAWNERKGLDVFATLSERLSDRFRILVVGTDEAVERTLPEKIMTIRKTENQRVLAEIYSAADIFVNPSREETFPTVNLEALACGTPVLAFDAGGSTEAADESCGASVLNGDADAMIRAICSMAEVLPTKDACRSRGKRFDQSACLDAYLRLYEEAAE